MQISTSKPISDFLKEQGDIYSSDFTDWLFSQDDVTVFCIDNHTSVVGCFEAGATFGATGKQIFYASSPYNEEIYALLGEESEVLAKLKESWQKEFNSDSPPLTDSEKDAYWELQCAKDELEEAQRRLNEVKAKRRKKG